MEPPSKPDEERPQRTVAIVKRAANSVYRALGPGLAEAVYRNALCVELQMQLLNPHVPVAMEVIRPIVYRGVEVGHHRHDLMCGSTIVEIKVVKTATPTAAMCAAHASQAARYVQHMKPSDRLVLVVFGVEGAACTVFCHAEAPSSAT